ncbi:SGNH/GDSL hydrolase family protein [Saccharibacillus alkalitolerans]|uniref:Lipase n=1 Tax=Saccharibacillus alkalitolerans TaxID=2705290 RepID=A0ABX0F822_9BACL|nr:SGNH/GDSL hydrolase family protein [Saccharibacillus alkalitolerans]NGZ75356.1 lipase [Saccharibacillus alkalitolerans]
MDKAEKTRPGEERMRIPGAETGGAPALGAPMRSASAEPAGADMGQAPGARQGSDARQASDMRQPADVGPAADAGDPGSAGGSAAANGAAPGLPPSAVPVLDGAAFHGAAELEPAPAGGVYLRRIPAFVRRRLGARGRFIAAESTGCELRFVTSSQTADVTLSLPVQAGTVTVYRGGMFHSEHRLPAGEIRTLRLTAPPRLQTADAARLSASGFAPDVWRVRFARGEAVYYGLNAFGEEVRPPTAGELPRTRLLAYGSSITHGGEQSRSAYIDQAARRLGADLYNLGMSGSCLCEAEMIDWIAGRDDWDIVFLELGVNMRDGMGGEEFREKVRYALERIAARHPDKPMFLTTIYPNFATLGEESPKAREQDLLFNGILREEVRRLNHDRLHLIEGDTVLDDPGGLSCDLIHPADEGHIRMGENLARQIRETLR